MAWTEKEAKALADRILSLSRAPECEVTLTMWRSAHTRFAANEVTTAGAVSDLRIHVASRKSGRSGSATVNDTAPDVLRRAVKLSEELMEVSPVDPEWVEGLGPQKYPSVEGFHAETAQAGA